MQVYENKNRRADAIELVWYRNNGGDMRRIISALCCILGARVLYAFVVETL